MRARFALLVAFFLVQVHDSRGQATRPRFEDYPATEPYKGSNAPVVLSRDDQAFRTRLRAAARLKPNYAAHYIVAAWGCGAECLMGAVIDANNGKVHWFPFTICCWGPDVRQPIAYRLDSRMIVFTGDRNEKSWDEGDHYYEIRDGKLTEVDRRRERRTVK